MKTVHANNYICKMYQMLVCDSCSLHCNVRLVLSKSNFVHWSDSVHLNFLTWNTEFRNRSMWQASGYSTEHGNTKGLANITAIARLRNNALLCNKWKFSLQSVCYTQARRLSQAGKPNLEMQWTLLPRAISKLHSSGTGYYEGLKYWLNALSKC